MFYRKNALLSDLDNSKYSKALLNILRFVHVCRKSGDFYLEFMFSLASCR